MLQGAAGTSLWNALIFWVKHGSLLRVCKHGERCWESDRRVNWAFRGLERGFLGPAVVGACQSSEMSQGFGVFL